MNENPNKYVALVVATLLSAGLAVSDAAHTGRVECVSTNTVLARCQSSSDKISISSELGSGDDAEFERARSLIVRVEGPNDGGDLENVEVVTQKPLENGGRSRLARTPGGVPTIVSAETPAPDLRQKDAVVIVDSGSGVPNLLVDASAGAPRQGAGAVVVVADHLENLSIKANGYSGASGEDVRETVAKRAILGELSPGLNAAYMSRRSGDLALPLPFDAVDINNYEASGLRCRADETPVGRPGSYAYDTAPDPSAVAEGINVTAFRREETSRAYCQRNAEFTINQQCEAEKEYAFQAVCRVKPEGRSVRFYNRNKVTWTRALCASSADDQVRRKIVRTAYVSINVPGVKSYSGQITREIRYADTYNVYRRALAGDGTTLKWVNPFWIQDPSLPLNDLRQISNSPIVWIDNNWPDDTYPGRTVARTVDDKQVSAGFQQGVKLTYKPRPGVGAASKPGDLFYFLPENSQLHVRGDTQNGAEVGGGTEGYNHTGCAPVIGDLNPRFRDFASKNLKDEAEYDRYVEFFTSFDASVLGFSHYDLQRATIVVKNCFAYEAVDGIVQGSIGRGNWSVSEGTPDASIGTLASGKRVVDEGDPGYPSVVSTDTECRGAYSNRIGSETFVQFEREDSCYVIDPRRPPVWLKRMKCVSTPGIDVDDPLTPETETCSTSPDAVIDAKIRSSDFLVQDLYNAQWVKEGATYGAKKTEFSYPPLTPESEKTTFQNFCVQIGNASPQYDALAVAANTLSRSVDAPRFAIAQNEETALPTGVTDKLCPEGLRLDNFLANVTRPSCPAGTSTMMRLSRWSSEAADGVWRTWSEKGPTSLPTEQHYTERSEYIETRYDQNSLPQQILTARTSDVHPGISLSPSASFTGEEFPPNYGFTTVVGGRTERLYPGWTRESSVKSSSGFVVPSSFVPYAGATQFERATSWCNAPAFQQVGNSMGRGFGAKGILRDAPKRVFRFDATTLLPSPATKAYIGIEIAGDGPTQGFYGSGIYTSMGGVSAASDLTNVNKPSGGLGPEAFKASNYPYLGARYEENCNAGEHYNALGGFCHAPGEPWKPARRVVERHTSSGTRVPWTFKWTAGVMADPSGRLDRPFYPASNGFDRGSEIPTNGAGEPIAPSDYFRLGLFRPLQKMADGSTIPMANFLNRPETVDRPVMSAGWAASLSNQNICQNFNFRMIAVPIPASTTSTGGKIVSVPLDRNGFLPAGSLYVSVTTSCSAGVVNYQGVVRSFNGSDVDPPLVAAQVNKHQVTTDPVTKELGLLFRNNSDQDVFKITGVTESLVSGISATSGEETLEFVEIRSPYVRNRAVEWPAARKKGGKGWQSRITTADTAPTQDQNTAPRECTAENLKDGAWASGVTNGSATLNCEDTGEGACALNAEELSLFTKPVLGSKTLTVRRPALRQYTPWSHELPVSAPKNPSYTTSQSFGRWVEVSQGGDGASVPDCSIFNGTFAEATLPRRSIDTVPKILEDGFWKIKNPGAPSEDFMILPGDDSRRQSDSCVRWDSVTGKSCDEFYPTVGGPEVSDLVFGGTWTNVYREKKERLAQDCSAFTGASCTGVVTPRGSPITAFCTPDTCPFQTNVQSYQVEAPFAISGNPGEDGTASGSAVVFCRDCRNVSFQGNPGSGGLGSHPISSTRSKTLTCVSWNGNNLSPVFSVRNLWSQPFVGGSDGQNGRAGERGGDMSIYTDMTPEAIEQLSDPDFWK